MDHIKSMEGDTVRMQAMLCDRRTVTEISSDFSLPDYQPPIKRLLHVRAAASEPDRYVGAAESELSGTVEYTVLYSDDAGEIYCTVQRGEYRFSVPMESSADFEIGDGLLCDAEILAEAPSGRVIAPRKLSLKCRLRSRVRFYGTRLVAAEIKGADSACTERLYGSAESCECFCGISEPIPLSDEILSDTEKGEIRVITSDAAVLVGEVNCGSGCVNCRGEAVLKLLCTNEETGGTPFSMLRRIPFSASVPTEGAEVNCQAVAVGSVSDTQITVEEGRILCEISLRIGARAYRNRAFTYTADAYSTRGDGEYSYRRICVPYAIRTHVGNFSLNTTLSLEEAGIRRDTALAEIFLTPISWSAENENGRYVISGKCRVGALLCTEGDAAMQEFEIPFRYVCEGGGEQVSDFDVSVQTVSCRARADGERLSVDAELAVSLSAFGKREIQMLDSALFSENADVRDCSYLICYPAREDTLWSVAKRYRRTLEDVMRINPIAEGPSADAPDSLAGVRYLLI